MNKLRKDDEVIVIAGRDRGRRGEVLEVRRDGRLIVSGVNLLKKHQRGDPNRGQQGGIVEREGPIDASNVAIWNDAEQRADRVGFRVETDGGNADESTDGGNDGSKNQKKRRYFKSTGEALEG